MASVTLKGNPFNTIAELPAVGSAAPDAEFTAADLSEITLAQYRSRRVILNVFPSVDTPTCAASVRRFNADASAQANTAVLCVSMDLPFAVKRFCAAEGLANVITASAFRSEFGADYGLTLVDGPLRGLLARAVIVIDAAGKIAYRQLVGEVANEPDYAAALASARA